MNTSRARAALIVAAIAIGCAFAGVGIDRWLMTRGPRHGRGGGPLSASATPQAAAKRRGEMLERMSRDLKLTPPQRAGIDSIMQRTDSALRVVRGAMQPRLTQIFESSRAEISTRLDSAQRVKFAQRLSSRRERH